MHHQAAGQTVYLADETVTADYALALAQRLQPHATLFFSGGLGAGKTTLIRHLLRQLGVTERVKSPTYTLMESYETRLGPAYHLDLYRLASADELAFITGRTFWDEPGLKLVEWPERGAGFLPSPDHWVRLSLASPEAPNARIAQEAASCNAA